VTLLTMPRPNRNLMTEDQLKRWVLRQLGEPRVRVELHPANLADIIEDAKEWFIAHKGAMRKARISLTSGQVEYDVPEDCDAVIDVAMPGNPTDISLVFAPWLLEDEAVPYDVFAAPESAGLYSSYAQAVQYSETAMRVISADFNWQWDPVTRKVLILPQPTTSYDMELLYRSTSLTFEQLDYFDFQLIKRKCLAEAKVLLGGIRRKYPSFPGAQGERQLDGAELRQEGREELEKLDEDIMRSNFPLPFITG